MGVESNSQHPSPDLDPGARPPRLHPHDVEWIAARVAELLANGEAKAGPARFADAPAVAEKIGVELSWVYAHARELGGVRLGGPRGQLRFDLQNVEQALACRDEQAIKRDPLRRHPQTFEQGTRRDLQRVREDQAP
jgi:hypothetical protein